MPIDGATSTQIRAEGFPDLGDELMYPRMSAKKLERLAEMGTRRSRGRSWATSPPSPASRP
ncbi:MAG: hypothetical protein H0V03_00570 [Thermoleophilaceae bacterium]|nr:hypothetical protein [Thermoleophilaceae bacterium]